MRIPAPRFYWGACLHTADNTLPLDPALLPLAESGADAVDAFMSIDPASLIPGPTPSTVAPLPPADPGMVSVDDLRRAFPSRAAFRAFLRTAPPRRDTSSKANAMRRALRALRGDVFGGLYGKGLRKMFAAKRAAH